MAEWTLSGRGYFCNFSEPSLMEQCVNKTVHIKRLESYTASDEMAPAYKFLMINIFKQALFDYTNTEAYAYSALKYLERLESLWFLGWPDVTGMDVIRRLDDWETFYRVSATTRWWYSAGKKRKRG